jgi:hypothetical protein
MPNSKRMPIETIADTYVQAQNAALRLQERIVEEKIRALENQLLSSGQPGDPQAIILPLEETVANVQAAGENILQAWIVSAKAALSEQNR